MVTVLVKLIMRGYSDVRMSYMSDYNNDVVDVSGYCDSGVGYEWLL